MNMDTGSRPMSRGRLILAILGTVALAALIVVGAILPAEFNRDPLGVGKLSGLARLWAPDETVIDPDKAGAARAREYATPYRTDEIEIPLGDFLAGAEQSELEYKVRMKKDATLIYSWEVVGTNEPRDFHYDQHGHTTPAAGSTTSSSAIPAMNSSIKMGCLKVVIISLSLVRNSFSFLHKLSALIPTLPCSLLSLGNSG